MIETRLDVTRLINGCSRVSVHVTVDGVPCGAVTIASARNADIDDFVSGKIDLAGLGKRIGDERSRKEYP